MLNPVARRLPKLVTRESLYEQSPFLDSLKRTFTSQKLDSWANLVLTFYIVWIFGKSCDKIL